MGHYSYSDGLEDSLQNVSPCWTPRCEINRFVVGKDLYVHGVLFGVTLEKGEKKWQSFALSALSG